MLSKPSIGRLMIFEIRIKKTKTDPTVSMESTNPDMMSPMQMMSMYMVEEEVIPI